MNKTKIFFNGKRLKDVYVGASKWQVFKYRCRKFFRRVTIISAVVLAGWTLVQIGSYVNPIIQYRVEAKEVVVDTLKIKIDDLKNQVVDGIKGWETRGIPIPDCDGKIVFDTNHKASIGCYQYQVKTVIYYVKLIEGRDITEAEAIAIATDHVKARALAYKIVWEKDGLKSNWYNYSQQVETKQLMAIIKGL